MDTNDTPRTDAVSEETATLYPKEEFNRMLAHACQLERELNAAKKEIDALKTCMKAGLALGAIRDDVIADFKRRDAEREALSKAKIEALEDEIRSIGEHNWDETR